MSDSLGVVPIFMSAGAAVLPTILAAIASIGAILLDPRKLVRTCRSHPAAAALTLVFLLACGGGWWLWSAGKSHTARAAAVQARAQIDWAKIAQDILDRQAAGQPPTPLNGSPTAPVAQISPPPVPAAAHSASDFAHTNSDGTTDPENLKPLWKFNPDQTMFLSRPAIFGNTVFVAGNESDLGGFDGLLAALDLDTGKPLWQLTELPPDAAKRLKQPSFPAFFSSPAVTPDGKYLIIGQGFHEDRNCALLCYEIASHALHWAVQTPIHIESSPAIFGDMVVVGAGAIEGKDGRAVGDPGYVFAVRISDGKELWHQAINDPESSPVIDSDGTVYIGSGCNGNAVAAIRSGSDEELAKQHLDRLAWKTPVPYPALGDVTLAGDLVIIGTGNGTLVASDPHPEGGVYAFDKKTGQPKWHTDTGDLVIGSIAYRDNTLVCGSRTGQILALAADTGKILWHNNPSGRSPILAGPAFTGKNVYAVSADGYLAVMDAKDGQLLGPKIPLNDPKDPGSGLSSCPPQIVGNRVIVGSETGGIRCLVGMSAGTGAAAGGAP